MNHTADFDLTRRYAIEQEERRLPYRPFTQATLPRRAAHFRKVEQNQRRMLDPFEQDKRQVGVELAIFGSDGV